MNEMVGSQPARPWRSSEESGVGSGSEQPHLGFPARRGLLCSPEKRGSGSTWGWGGELVGQNACPQLRA